MADPEISVVIPSWNGAPQLALTLRCLAKQSLMPEQYEVIVADDGSVPSLSSAIPAESFPFRIHFVALPHTGNRARVRNAGAARAAGRLLVFLDSDMLLEQDALRVHLAEAGRGRVSLGVRLNLQPISMPALTAAAERGVSTLSELPASDDERGYIRTYRRAISEQLLKNWHLLYSHNFCVSRGDFESVGGFDEQFGAGWGAEDIELGFRLAKAGCMLTFADAARAYQVAHDADLVRNVRSLRQNLTLFFQRHPHWQVELHRREYQMWFTEYVDLLEAVATFSDRAALPSAGTIARLTALSSLNEPCLFVGFPTFESATEAQRTFVFPRRLDAPAVSGAERDLLGTALQEPDSYYATCCVNSSLRQIGVSAFELVTREAQRVARRVFYVDPESDAVSEPPRQTLPRRFLFTLSDDCAESRERDDFYRLALALSEQGAQVGLQFASDPFSTQTRYAGFGGLYSPQDRRRLDALFSHDFNLLAEEVTAVMAPSLARWTNRSIDSRVIWLLSEPATEAGSQGLRGSAEVWIAHPSEGAFVGERPTRVVRPGVSLDKLSQVGPRPVGPFTFLWCSHAAGESSGLLEAVKAFRRAFSEPSARDVRLRILCDDLKAIPPRMGRGATSARRRQLWAEASARQEALDRYLDEVRALAAVDSRIQCEFGDHSQDGLARALAHCDTLLCTDSAERVSPFVVESVCLGKRPLVACAEAYRALLQPGDIESFASAKGNFSIAELAAALQRHAQDPARSRLAEGAATKYTRAFSWQTIAAELLREPGK